MQSIVNLEADLVFSSAVQIQSHQHKVYVLYKTI